MNEFEQNVLSDLATLKERTADHAQLRNDVAEIKGKVRLLEFKAALAGSAAGTVFAVVAGYVKSAFGR